MINNFTIMVSQVLVNQFRQEVLNGKMKPSDALVFIESDNDWFRNIQEMKDTHGMADSDSLAGIVFDAIEPLIDWSIVRSDIVNYLKG